MRHPLIAPVLACALLAGCVANDTPVTTRPAPFVDRDRALIQSAIIDDMKDPGAAQLRKLVAYDLSEGQGRVLCGEVNGKNSFGAYVGFQPFFLRIKDGRAVTSYVGAAASDDLSGALATKGCTAAASGQMMVAGAK